MRSHYRMNTVCSRAFYLALALRCTMAEATGWAPTHSLLFPANSPHLLVPLQWAVATMEYEQEWCMHVTSKATHKCPPLGCLPCSFPICQLGVDAQDRAGSYRWRWQCLSLPGSCPLPAHPLIRLLDEIETYCVRLLQQHAYLIQMSAFLCLPLLFSFSASYSLTWQRTQRNPWGYGHCQERWWGGWREMSQVALVSFFCPRCWSLNILTPNAEECK